MIDVIVNDNRMNDNEDELLINNLKNSEVKSETINNGVSISDYGSTVEITKTTASTTNGHNNSSNISPKKIINNLENNENKKYDEDDPYGAYYLYKYIVLIQLFLYMEAGIVPALLSQFTLTFDLTHQYQGLLGAIVYLALSLATPFCAYCYRTKNAKYVITYSLFANGIALILFMSTPTSYGKYSKIYLIASRGCVGFTQAFFNVYAPLWVHQYTPTKYRARCMGYLQGATPLGATIGYFIGSVAIWFSHGRSEDDNGQGTCYAMLCWRWALLVPIFAIIPLSFLAFKFVPNEHVMLRNVHLRSSFMIVEEDEDKETNTALLSLSKDEEDTISLLTSSQQTSTAKIDVWQELLTLFHTPVYICVVLCLSALFFVVTGIQYWVTLFLVTNTQDSIFVIHLSYLFCAGTGPFLGVMFGGYIIDKTGGYSNTKNNNNQETKALGICTILGLIAVLSTIPPSFLNNTYYISMFLWITLFTGASILPACSGIVITSITIPTLRPFATAFAATSYNLLGYAASNYIPGVIMTIVRKSQYFSNFCENDDHNACLYKLGFRVVLFWSFFALFFISTAWLCSKRKNNNR